MTRPKYMRMKIKDLPEEFVTMYNLTSIATVDGFFYIKIQKGIYGLPQVLGRMGINISCGGQTDGQEEALV
jgi:hypothetical protein